MPRRLVATAISRHLAGAHTRSTWVDGEWTAGFRVASAGRSTVVVWFECPPGEAPGLEPVALMKYGTTLRSLGYRVEVADRPMLDGQGGWRKLYVTRGEGDA